MEAVIATRDLAPPLILTGNRARDLGGTVTICAVTTRRSVNLLAWFDWDVETLTAWELQAPETKIETSALGSQDVSADEHVGLQDVHQVDLVS